MLYVNASFYSEHGFAPISKLDKKFCSGTVKNIRFEKLVKLNSKNLLDICSMHSNCENLRNE